VSELITLTPEDLGTVEDHGTIVRMTGTSEDSSERVLVAGDHRPIWHLFEAVAVEQQPVIVAPSPGHRRSARGRAEDKEFNPRLDRLAAVVAPGLLV